jgi:hypothetical protein
MHAPPRAYQIRVGRFSSLTCRTRLLFFLKRVTNQKAPHHPLTRGSDPWFARPVYDPRSQTLLMSALGQSSLLLTSANLEKKKKKKPFYFPLYAFYFICNIQKKKKKKIKFRILKFEKNSEKKKKKKNVGYTFFS